MINPTWEYKVAYDLTPRQLMYHGKIGWELVKVITQTKIDMYFKAFTYKREKYIFKRIKNEEIKKH